MVSTTINVLKVNDRIETLYGTGTVYIGPCHYYGSLAVKVSFDNGISGYLNEGTHWWYEGE